jgi:hypothetical protein
MRTRLLLAGLALASSALAQQAPNPWQQPGAMVATANSRTDGGPLWFR